MAEVSCYNCGSENLIGHDSLWVCLDCREVFRLERDRKGRAVQVRLTAEQRTQFLAMLRDEALVEPEPEQDPEPKPEPKPEGDDPWEEKK